MRRAIAILIASLLLPACSREEEPVADRFERQKAEIENKARAYEAQVESEVSAAEARLDNEADALLNATFGNAAEANGSAANAAAEADVRR